VHAVLSVDRFSQKAETAQKKNAAPRDSRVLRVRRRSLNKLPSEMGKGLVGIRHAMHVLASSDRRTLFLVSGQQLFSELLGGRSTLLFANGHQNPTDGKRLLTLPVHLHWNLIGSTANSLRSNFNIRLHVLHRLVKYVRRTLVRHLFLDDVQSSVENLASDRFLAAVHHAVDELAGQQRSAHRIGLQLSFAGCDSSHC
jgi:hypothetical protein